MEVVMTALLRLALALLFVVPAGLAVAGSAVTQLSMPLGQTRSVNLSERVASIEVSDPSVLRAERRADGSVLLSPIATGKARVELRTSGDVQVNLLVYVTTGGHVEFISRR
jgi:Flp pilus assembly secretin CpaC